ncbi:uncharacterized protein si:dkeyp-84f3.9 isoform X2 [Esox lucius]|nr:uncharacterized protein si:dkeyp-84f3.9 isoform X2 [Esox lucius]
MPPMKEPLGRQQQQRKCRSQQEEVVDESRQTVTLPNTPVLTVLANSEKVPTGDINPTRKRLKSQANTEKIHVSTLATSHVITQCKSGASEEQTMNCIRKEPVDVTRPAVVAVVRKRGRPHKKVKIQHTDIEPSSSVTDCVENMGDKSHTTIEMDTVPLKHEISHTVVSALDLSTQEHLTAESSPVTVLPLETKRKRGRPKGSTKKGQGKTMNTNLVQQSNVTEDNILLKNEPEEKVSKEAKKANTPHDDAPVVPKRRVGRPPKKTTLVRQIALTQRKSCSNAAPVNTLDRPPQHQEIEPELSLDSKGSYVSVSLSRVDSQRGGKLSGTAHMISNVKCEDTEIELGDFNSLAQSSCLSFQCQTETTIKAEPCIAGCESTEIKKPLKINKCKETTETSPRKRSRFVFGKNKYKKGKRKKCIDRRKRQCVTLQEELQPTAKQTGEDSGDVGKEMNCGEAAWEYEGNASNSFSTRMMSTNEGLKDFTDCHQNAVTSDVDLLGTMSNESVSETDNVQNEEYIGKNIKKESDGLDNESEYNPKSSYAKTRGRPKGRPKGTGKTCEYCNRHFDFVSVYTVHLRTHTGERPYKCIDCDQDFAQLSNLKSHIKKHNKRCGRLMCPYCKIKFVNSKELLAHCKWHSQNLNQDSDPVVSKKDNRNDVTHRAHISPSERRKRGTGDTLKCHICGKVFPFLSGLQVHIRMHTGEKPYNCKVCGKAFSNLSSIRIHEVTHWSIKPYSCTRCGKTFTQFSSAKKHPCKVLRDNIYRQSQKKPLISFTCHICEERFVQRRQYKTHLKTHAGAKLFRCLFCDQLFSVISEFEEHRQYCTKVRGEKTTSKSEFRIWRSRSPNQELSNPPPSKLSQKTSVKMNPPPDKILQKPSVNVNSSVHHSPAKSHSPVIQSVCPTPPHSQPPHNLEPSSASSASFPNPQRPAPMKRSAQRSSQTPRKKAIAASLRPFHTCVIPSQNLSPLVIKLNSLDRKSDPRKYLCPRCGRLFRHTGRLRAHMLTHVRSQSYTCDCCGKTLESWKRLWLHQRVHRQKLGRFSCPKCRQGFRFVGPYKQHILREHPEYRWIDERPKKTLQVVDQQQCLPYQCEECNTSFRTLDLLFNHQLCHSSTGDNNMWIQDDCYAYSSSTNEHDASAGVNGLDPHMNSGVTQFHHTYYPSPPQVNHPQSSHLPTSFLSSHSDLTYSPSSLLSAPPATQHPGFQPDQSYNAIQPITSPLSSLYTQVETIPNPDRKDGNVNRKRIRSNGNATKRSPRSKEDKGTTECVDCAECGVQFSAVSELYEHYLQHARGEV